MKRKPWLWSVMHRHCRDCRIVVQTFARVRDRDVHPGDLPCRGEGSTISAYVSDGARPAMQTFYVQVKCELGRTYEVAGDIAAQELHSEIFSTAGEFDLIVKYHVDDELDIGHFVGESVHQVAGIRDTKTIITFKAF
jgi:DNA-binding Lrp family transcriptional regulator